MKKDLMRKALSKILLAFKAFLKASFFFLFLAFLASNTHAELGLMVVDMQKLFYEGEDFPEKTEAANQKRLQELLHNQQQAIEAAKKANLPIFFVSYIGFGYIFSPLKESLKGYDKVIYLQKNADDLLADQTFFGGDHSRYKRQALQQLKAWNIDRLIVMGVNAQSCVKCTMESLRSLLRVEVMPFLQGIGEFGTTDTHYSWYKSTGASTITFPATYSASAFPDQIPDLKSLKKVVKGTSVSTRTSTCLKLLGARP